MAEAMNAADFLQLANIGKLPMERARCANKVGSPPIPQQFTDTLLWCCAEGVRTKTFTFERKDLMKGTANVPQNMGPMLNMNVQFCS